MDRNDRQAIEELFQKLRDVERRTPPRDPDAESYIAQQVAQQPSAPYYMAQTIIVQEQALEAAQRRLEELDQLPAARGPWSGQRGGRSSGGAPNYQPGYYGGGGGFLAGAAQTALGVAGGVLLANLITGAFAGGEAQAAEAPPETGNDADADGGDFETGTGDFDAGGDLGGDF